MQNTLVTVVSLYGRKDEPLAGLLARVQDIAAQELGVAFRPYPPEQVHGTLIVLGGHRDDDGGIVNEHYLTYRREHRRMDFELVQRLLLAHLAEPVQIRIGGFGPLDESPFLSQGRPLHERSFWAVGGALVLIGWPVVALASAGRSRPLDALRRAMASAGVLHRYHGAPSDVDDDFHAVVGHYAPDVPPGQLAAAVGAVRDFLAGHPIDVQIGLGQVRILAADSPTLAAPWFSSRLPVAASTLAGLYR